MAAFIQFSITAELTKLVPLALQVASKSYEAAMNLARSLQISGSDIVVEEDLAEMFARAQVSAEMESTFKTVVMKAEALKPLVGTLGLFSGPGPTVQRAAKDKEFLSTVVQCSFLCSTHDKTSLADALWNYCEIVAQGAPEGWNGRAIPSPDGLRRTLQAIETQTESFNSWWWSTLSQISAQLFSSAFSLHSSIRLSDSGLDMYDTLPPVVLRGLISMLPRVQRMRNELLQVQTHTGVCCIVVWSHHILGLTVVVRFNGKQRQTKELRFGQGQESVIIDFKKSSLSEDFEPTVTLLALEKEAGEPIFILRPEREDGEIEPIITQPSQGCLKRVLERELGILQNGRERVLKELTHIACASAVCISKRLCVSTFNSGPNMEGSMDEMSLDGYEDNESLNFAGNEDDVVVVPELRIVDAARILLNDPKLTYKDFSDHILEYSKRSLVDVKDTPKGVRQIIEAFQHEMQRTGHEFFEWEQLHKLAVDLSLIILAFANITDIRAAAEFPISAAYQTVLTSSLSRLVSDWDGVGFIAVNENVWFEIITLLMTGERGEPLYLEDTCLVSERGWSAFINTFGHADPYNLDPGYVCVMRGVPWRNGVWKHKVIAGPIGPEGPSRVDEVEWRKEASQGETVRLNSGPNVEYGQHIIGERGDSFIISIRLELGSRGSSVLTRRGAITGSQKIEIERKSYKQLWKSRWVARTTRPCGHAPNTKDKLTLDVEWLAISILRGFGNIDELKRLTMCLTARKPASRWFALHSVLPHHQTKTHRVMLKGQDCCVSCAAQQTAMKDGDWFLVL